MNYGVSAAKLKSLEDRMRHLGILETDLEEKFIRSGGHGGQNVNKTSTCVYLHHRPTGMAVKCQAERVQSLNRFLARRLLMEKIEKKILGQQSMEQQRVEKIRRQKRKRSKRSRLKMLEDKRHHSEKKSLRAATRDWE